ncbi:hypothetical protein GEMRC1_004855 [Eukaryota sp. GEM-RC1]
MCKVNPLFSDYGQHDAFELLLTLFSGISTEQKDRDSTTFSETFSSTVSSSFSCMVCATVTSRPEQLVCFSLPLFNSKVSKRHHLIRTSLPEDFDFSDLALPPPRPFHHRFNDLLVLFNYFCHPELLTDDSQRISCKVCTIKERQEQAKVILQNESLHSPSMVQKARDVLSQELPSSNDSDDENCPSIPSKRLRKRPAIKQFMLTNQSFPPVLCFHIKRFKSNGVSYVKDNSEVEFPLSFSSTDLNSEIFTERCVPFEYKLVSIVCHSGCLNYGHYIAYSRHVLSGDWYYFSDESFREVSIDSVLQCQPYLLFYYRD